MRYWPTPQEYNEAIQNPKICFADPELKQSVVALNPLGLPRCASGTFASVYKLTAGEQSFAVRCFLSERPEQKERYRHISDFILFDDLDSTVDFHYLEEGIKIKKEWFPCLKMIWVEGETLDQYVDKYYQNSEKITALLKEFHKLVGEMEGAGIAHGDLQHGNIMVSPAGLRLVDYDALFVPALAGRKSLEIGHPNYQHPGRTENDYDPDVDNFSCWVIHMSLLMIAIDPALYKQLGGGDDCLLFKKRDFIAPDESRTLKVLLDHPSPYIRESAVLLKRMLKAPLNSIPYLGAPKERLEALPELEEALKKGSDSPDTGNGDGVVSGAGSSAGGAPDERAKLPVPAPPTMILGDAGSDIASAYAAIDSIQSCRKKKAVLDKAYDKTFAAGRKARDRIKKLAEDLERSTAPSSWLYRKMREAKRRFLEADYEEAIKLFLQVYKEVSHDNGGARLIDVLTWLGYSYALNGNHTLASNYFLLALNAAKADAEDEISFAQLTALSLAICRYESGNEALAFKILDDNRGLLIGLSELFSKESPNVFLRRSPTFYLLQSYGLQLLMTNEHQTAKMSSEVASTQNTLAREVLHSAMMLLDRIAEEQPASCDERMLDAGMTLGSGLFRSKLYGMAQHAFFDLARISGRLNSPQTAKLAKFCGAVAISVDNPNLKVLRLLSDWGTISEQQLLDMAITAKAFVSQSDIANLLVSIGAAFSKINSSSESREAVNVLLKFAISCRGSVDDPVITLIESLDQDLMLACLQSSYLAESADSGILDRFARRLLERRSTKALSIIVNYLAESGDEKRLTCILALIANKDEVGVFRSVLRWVVTNGDQPSLKSSPTEKPLRVAGQAASESNLRKLNTILNSCRMEVGHLFERLDEMEVQLGSQKTRDSKAMDQCLATVDLLQTFRSLLKVIGQTEQADEIAQRLTAGDYEKVLQWWIAGTAGQEMYEKIADFSVIIVATERLDLLQSICHYPWSGKLVDGLNFVCHHLLSNNQLNALIEVSLLIAAESSFDLFDAIIAQFVERVDGKTLLAFCDRLIERTTGTERARSLELLTKCLMRGKRQSVLANLLEHLLEQGAINWLAPMALSFLGAAYSTSVLSALVAKNDFQTIGRIVRMIASFQEGLDELMKLLRDGGVKYDITCAIFIAALKDCRDSLAVMHESLEEEKERRLAEPSKSEAQEQGWLELNVELPGLMRALHNLRTFDFPGELDADLADPIAETLDEQYDDLIVLSVFMLLDENDVEAIPYMVVELAEHKKSACIFRIAEALAEHERYSILHQMTERLMEAGFPFTVVNLAISLIDSHGFKTFKSLTEAMIDNGHNHDAIAELIIHAAEHNTKIADIIVRQLSHNDQGQLLKSLALRLAREKRFDALTLVLNELLAAEQIDLSSEFDTICDAAGKDGVEPLAQWLIELGLAEAVAKRAALLKESGRGKEASSWLSWLENA